MNSLPVELSIGSHRWSVVSGRDRYVDLLADRFRIPLGPAQCDADLKLVVRTDSVARPLSTDRIDVARRGDLVTLSSDPAVLRIERSEGAARAELVVRDPTMSDDLLGYHLWMLVNRSMLELDRFLLHGAALVVDGRTVVVCGMEDAGKSTLATALALEGATVLSEDWLLVTRKDELVLVSGVSSTMRLDDDTCDWLLDGPPAGVTRTTDPQQKLAFDASLIGSSAPAVDHRPDRLYLLTVGDDVAQRPASALSAVRHIVESTKWMLRIGSRDDAGRYLDAVTALVGSVPCVALQRTSRRSDMPRVIEAIRS